VFKYLTFNLTKKSK